MHRNYHGRGNFGPLASVDMHASQSCALPSHRAVAARSAFTPLTAVSCHCIAPSSCHLNRSAAEWRDPRHFVRCLAFAPWFKSLAFAPQLPAVAPNAEQIRIVPAKLKSSYVPRRQTNPHHPDPPPGLRSSRPARSSRRDSHPRTHHQTRPSLLLLRSRRRPRLPPHL